MGLIKSISKRLDNWYDRKYNNFNYFDPDRWRSTKTFHKIIWKSNNEGEMFRWFGKFVYHIETCPLQVNFIVQFPFTRLYIKFMFSIGGYRANW